jgi:putative ABC transport system permease protein
MTAIWMRTRSELRSHLAGVIALVLLVGLIGGVVVAAAAGARRTVTAYPRFLKAENAFDLVVNVFGRDPGAIENMDHQIQNLPQVRDSSLATIAKGYLRIPGRKAPGNVFLIVSPDGNLGFTINRPKILEGRMLNPAATDELFPSLAVAQELGLRVGQTVQIAYGGLFSNVPQAPPGAPKPVTMHVVGIGAMPSMFQPLAGGYLPGVLVSSGFASAYPKFLPRETDVVVALHGGETTVPKFQSVIQGIRSNLPPHLHVGINFTQASQTGGVQQATRATAVALWVLAILVGIAGLAIFAQALSRQTFIESIEYPTLKALGVSPAQLFTVGMIRVALIGIAGAVLAAIVGFLLSPLLPTGIARVAEPHPGFALDGLMLGVGGVAVAVLTLLVGALPVWRAATAKWTALGTAAPRRPVRRGAAARAIGSFPPSGRAGVRMALDPGAGRTAVPVRTAVFGAAITLVALASALAFGASLSHLETAPGLSGRTWDSLIFVGGNPAKKGSEAQRLVSTIDGSRSVSAYSLGALISARVANGQVTVESLDPQRGDIEPALIEGRVPSASNEIALGSQTMQSANAHIGGTVIVKAEGGQERLRVVGRIAMPNLFFSFTRPGQGAAMTLPEVRRLGPRQARGNTGVFVRYAPGAEVGAFVASLHRQFPHIFIPPPPQSAQLSSLNEVGRFPLILAGILALMAVATLAHTLITSIRRRRQDIAVLKTLGFVRGQVSATVAWQATTLGVLSLLIGVPLGIVAGRWGWNVFADHLGVVPDAVIPGILLLIIAPATIVVANLLAVVPGRVASRLRPATVLRSE